MNPVNYPQPSCGICKTPLCYSQDTQNTEPVLWDTLEANQSNSSVTTITKCQHVFHACCLYNELAVEPGCPTCNTPLDRKGIKIDFTPPKNAYHAYLGDQLILAEETTNNNGRFIIREEDSEEDLN